MQAVRITSIFCFCLSKVLFFHLPAGKLQSGEKGTCSYFRCLTSCGIIIGSEVGQITGTTRLPDTTTRVSRHYVSRNKPVCMCIISASYQHILELLAKWLVVEARRVGRDLGYLTSCGIIIGSEVGQITGTTRLPDTTTRITINESFETPTCRYRLGR